MAVPIDVLVRAGGSSLLAAVGVTTLLLAKGRRGTLALGAFLTLHGLNLVFNNLDEHVAAVNAVWSGPIDHFVELGIALAIVGMALWWPEPLRPHERRRVAVALAFIGLVVLVQCSDIFLQGVNDDDPGRPLPFRIVEAIGIRLFYGAFAAFPLVLALRFAATRPEETEARRRLAFAALAFGAMLAQFSQYLVDRSQLSTLDLGLAVSAPATLLLAVVVAPAWVAATRGPDGRLARNVAHVLLAIAFASLAAAVFFPGSVNALVGATRALVAAAWAYGIARLGFLGYDLKVRTAERGTLAMAALATLFIVAQVAQEFLAAEYGLLMGGIVAGAFLFAAQPIQRALEGRRAPTAPARDSAKEEAYRKALRLAIRDGRVTREEELHLHEVAEHMGISVRRAHELLVEVERELQRDRV